MNTIKQENKSLDKSKDFIELASFTLAFLILLLADSWHSNSYWFRTWNIFIGPIFLIANIRILKTNSSISIWTLSICYLYFIYFTAFYCGLFSEVSFLFAALAVISAYKRLPLLKYKYYLLFLMPAILLVFYFSWQTFTRLFACPYGLAPSYFWLTWVWDDYQLLVILLLIKILLTLYVVPKVESK